jgi:tRNA-splicing ligase RtcB
MAKELTARELLSLGFKEGPVIGYLLEAGPKLRNVPAGELRRTLKKLRRYPELFLDDPILQAAARSLHAEATAQERKARPLLEAAAPYTVWGQEGIETGANAQMEVAVRLPVAVAGALMPDAHQGYGLPIGGVLATNNAVIPYGVGVDIGCRMALSIFDIPEHHLFSDPASYKRELVAHTKFGAGSTWNGVHKAEHPVLDDPAFGMTPLLRSLRDKAAAQLGTSGGGNHFVEWGVIEFTQRDRELDIEPGKYLALLTHSGSRGLGATLANHYTKLAKEICPLPREAANLAYLSLDSEAGQEYWTAMTLAGDYASACHAVIHERLTKAIGGNLLARVENHHNFAWKEELEGREVIVHRKGATPAGKGIMGIIPGSMTAPGFLVRGRGFEGSLNSASHGAGRQMSRSQAVKTISRPELQSVLKDHGVQLIGGGLDEAPMAYKDINAVMAAQSDLVDIVARFTPKIVRMADDGSKED